MKLILSDSQLLNINVKDNDVKCIYLSSLKISNCIGCFGCWTKTPGKCVIRDDAVSVYPHIANSDKLIYISRIKYGGYDTVLKTMLERAIPIQKAFIRIVDGETHHVQRNVKLKDAVIIGYGKICDEEKEVFKKLVERNARNMNFKRYEIVFTSESKLTEIVTREVKKWQVQV